MASTNRRKVGVNLKFFSFENETTTQKEPGTLDLEKFKTALRGYSATLDRVGSIDRDDQYKEFVSVGQQILGELEGREADELVRLLKWEKEQSFGLVL